MITANKLRGQFIDFFEGKNHKVLPSASLLPAELDPSVLFNTAGMQQFKRFYSEPDHAPAARVTTSQKCIRTGDIDEVGDNTHGTFFEMLGNFSFGYPQKEGSYFKKESIMWGWEFLTEVLKIEKNRIHATYFEGNELVGADLESLEILSSIDGLGKVVPQGFDDNFWTLGTENSPGGPTVEFYIDDVEVWNLVFNEYVFRGGKFKKAEFQGVDTGMGLERLLAGMNGFDNVYKTDLHLPIIEKIGELSNQSYENYVKEYRVIADHLKTATFAIGDGASPSNKGAGYIVRRLIRRAIVKANEIGIKDDFTIKIAEKVFEIYDGVYAFDKTVILAELEKEEKKFRKTLNNAFKQLILLSGKPFGHDASEKRALNGDDLFNLFQSYGMPIEITLEEAKRLNISVENKAVEQFNNLMQQHQELSKTASAGMFKGGLAEAGEITTKYHSATHLLLAALRQVLGDHVFQKGSNITAERMRFDFSHPEKMTPEQVKEVEDIVNEQIEKDLPVLLEEKSVEEAKAEGAMGVFDSKYGEKVKVYTIGKSNTEYFSKEICGGPHIKSTKELGHFKITKEEASSAGVRRIKAVLE